MVIKMQNDLLFFQYEGVKTLGQLNVGQFFLIVGFGGFNGNPIVFVKAMFSEVLTFTICFQMTPSLTYSLFDI